MDEGMNPHEEEEAGLILEKAEPISEAREGREADFVLPEKGLFGHQPL